MMSLTREQIVHIVGHLDDDRVLEIMGAGATADDLLEANTWLGDGDHLGARLRRPLSGVVARLVEILKAEEPDMEER